MKKNEQLITIALSGIRKTINRSLKKQKTNDTLHSVYVSVLPITEQSTQASLMLKHSPGEKQDGNIEHRRYIDIRYTLHSLIFYSSLTVP